MGLPVPKPSPTILLTRPQAQSEQFAAALRDRELRNVIVISPLLEILPTGNGEKLDSFEEAIFTSRNALDFVPAAQKRAWCVGDKTAEKARALGWDAVSADGNVDDLAAAIVAANPAAPLMHFHGEHSTRPAGPDERRMARCALAYGAKARCDVTKPDTRLIFPEGNIKRGLSCLRP